MNDLVVTPHPLTLDGRRIERGALLLEGENLAQFLVRNGVDIAQEGWVVTIGGAEVPALMWSRTKPAPGQLIEVVRVAGKKVLYVVALIVLAYFTFGTGLGAAGGLGGYLGFTGFTAFAINVGVYMVGSMLINKMLGPPKLKLPNYAQDTASTYSLQGGRNRARPFEPLGLLFGVMKVVPDYAAQPYSWFEGEDQYQYIRLHAGINCGSIDQLKIGNTLLSTYSGVTVNQSGFPGTSTQLEDWANVDTVTGALLDAPTAPGAWVVRTSSANTVRLAIDIGVQLYKMRDDGGFDNAIVDFDAEIRLLPSGAWQPFNGIATSISQVSKSTAPLRQTLLTATLPAGQYEVRLRKTTANVATTREANAVEWGSLKSYQLDSTDYSAHPHVGIKIKASGQLNGALDEVNWVASSAPTPVWNGSAWVTQVTRNPGAQILQFARGIFDDDGRLMAGMGLPDAQIDIEGLQAFMLHCAANGYVFDHWFDTAQLSCQDVIEAMAAAGFGSISHHPGKLSVVWAAEGQPIEAVVAMGNVKLRSFRVDYTTRETAEELEVTWPDRDTGWLPASVRVKAPGVVMPRDTARLAPAGTTTAAAGLRMARLFMAQNIYQRKAVSWEMDLEYLTFRRYSVLALSHDVTQWGYSGRLRAAQDVAGVITLTLDEEVPAGVSARYVGLRLPGDIGYRVFGVAAFAGSSHTLTLTTPWPVGVALPGSSADNPAHDTIWIYDFVAQPGYRLRVVGIEPTENLSGAKITAVPEPDEFWDYISSGDYEAPTGTYMPEPVVVSGLVLSQERVTLNYDNSTELTATFDVSGPFDHAQVWAAMDGEPLQLVGETRTRRFGPRRVPTAGIINVEVRPFDALGRPGTVDSVAYDIELDAPIASTGTFTDFVFKRSATMPATPTGDGTPAGWFDAPPADDGNPLWFSLAQKTATNALIGVWAEPVQIDGKSLQVEYSVDGLTGWHEVFATGDIYARYRVGETGAWSDAVKIVGEDGADGAKSALVFIYKRSATLPDLPTVNSTFTFATGVVSGMDNGWSATPPGGSDPLYGTVASATGTGATDTITPGEWVTPTIWTQDGAAGANSATVELYQRTSSASAPSLPGSSLTYTFATGLLSGTLGAWSQGVPSSGGKYLHVTRAVAYGSGTTDTILSSEWAPVSIMAQDGDPGQKTALVAIYQRGASAPPLPTNDTTTFYFDSGVVAGMNNGWAATPPAGSNPLWVSYASAIGSGTTDTITHGEWTTAVVLVQDGAAGLNTATVWLYQRNNTGTPPSVPGSSLTYTFATGVLSGSLGSWTQNVPSSAGGKYLFQTTATAVSSGATDTVLSSEWATPQIMAQDGDTGGAGLRGSLIGSSTSVSPAIYSTAPWNGATDNTNARNVIWQMLGNGGSAPNDSHLRVGDIVTLRTSSGSDSKQRYWSGSTWLDVDTVFSGNVLVGGTISGGLNLNITGFAKFEGANSYTVSFSSGSSSVSTAVIANTSGASQYGVIGQSSTGGMAGVYGYNSSSAGNSAGVSGYSPNVGVLAFGGVAGVSGLGTVSTANGVSGLAPLATGSGAGLYATNALNTNNFALKSDGKAQFSAQIHSTVSTGTAPFVIASTTEVANLNVAALKGKTWAAPDPIGATTPASGRFTSMRIDQGSASGTGAWNLPAANTKPGASTTGVFVPMNFNGADGDTLWWPRS